MSHPILPEQLADLALGLLEPEAARRVEAHAAGCPACAAELASLRGARAALAALPPLAAPERGEAVLLAAARREAGHQARRPGWTLPRWLWGAAFGAATAAAAVLLVLRGPGSPPPSRFDEGRDALLGQAPAPQAATPWPAVPASPAPGRAGAAAAGAASAPASRPAGPARQEERRAKAAPGSVAAAPAEGQAPRVASPSADHAAIGVGDAAPAAGRAAEATPPLPAAPPPRLAEEAPSAPGPRAGGAPAAAAEAEAPRPSPPALRAVTGEAKGLLRAAAARPVTAQEVPAASRPPIERLAFPDCPAERTRTLTRDAAGRLLRRERSGALAGTEYWAEERFGEDGRLAGAAVRLGDRQRVLGPAELARDGLEPFPGLILAPTAAAAEGGPPACRP